MPLVRTLSGKPIYDDLRRAYVTLAQTFLQHRGGGDVTTETDDPCALDSAVCQTELHVDLREAQKQCNLIDTPCERPVEIFNNLNHMFVLLQEIPILAEQCSLQPLFCAPTQQSDHADLEGEKWSSEAFGGMNITNNGKLAKELRTLSKAASLGHRTFLAFRTVALPRSEAWNGATVHAISGRCAKPHGGPFVASAQGSLIGRLNGVTVIEVQGINVSIG